MSIDLANVFHAIGAGAATVYHDVLAVSTDVTTWENNPAVAPLLSIGLDYATALLGRLGVPLDAVSLAGADILAGVKALAALDATVASAPGSTAPTAAG